MLLEFHHLTITRHPLSQSLLKDSARQSMSATLKYACWREGCVVMTPARLYQLLAKEWAIGRVYSQSRPNVTPLEGITLADMLSLICQHRTSSAMCPLTQVHFVDSVL